MVVGVLNDVNCTKYKPAQRACALNVDTNSGWKQSERERRKSMRKRWWTRRKRMRKRKVWSVVKAGFGTPDVLLSV